MNKIMQEKRDQIELRLLELDHLYELVPSTQKTKSVNAIRSYRNEKWEKALKIAKNDFEKASEIYDTV